MPANLKPMNNTNLYFDGALGQFIGKRNYDLISVDPDLEVQHATSSKTICLGTEFQGNINLYISHATALGLTGSAFSWDVYLAPYNNANLPVWENIASGNTSAEKPGGTTDTVLLATDMFTLGLEKYPRGVYWMKLHFSNMSDWMRSFPIILHII